MPDDPRPLPGRKADEGPVGESRPRSPARFAVEALTIVFSILVALGIDTAADVWSERRSEAEYLGLLREEFAESRDELEADRRARETIGRRSRTLLAWAAGRAPQGEARGALPPVDYDLAAIPSPLPLDSAVAWVGSIRDFRYFTPVQVVLDDLVSSGSFGVIESAEVRRLILRLRQEEERIAVVEERERDFAARRIEPWLARSLPLEAMENGTADTGEVERRLRALALEPEFRSLLELRLSRTETAYRFSGGLSRLLRTLVQELE